MNEHTNVNLVRVQKTKNFFSLMRIGGGFSQEETVFFFKK